MDERKLKITAVVSTFGLILSWLPVAATLITGLVGSILARQFRVDWLMPAEMFPVVLAGFLLLLWSALRQKRDRLVLVVSFGAAVAFLSATQIYAMASGIGSGAVEAERWQLSLLFTGLGLFDFGVLAVAIIGIRLAAAARQALLALSALPDDPKA